MFKSVNIIWYNSAKVKNFGDELTPYIVSKIFYVKPHNTLIEGYLRYNLFTRFIRKILIILHLKDKSGYEPSIYYCIGSILNNTCSNSVVWGSGIMSRDAVIGDGKILAVRGYETLTRLEESNKNINKIAIGDPSILLPLIYKPSIKKRFKLGIIPHYVDYDIISEKYRSIPDISIINLCSNNVEMIIDQILECECTISSSLHGIIVSHIYNVPCIWFKFSSNLKGDDVKFDDYFSSVAIPSYPPFSLSDLNSQNDLLTIIQDNIELSHIHVDLGRLQRGLLETAPWKRCRQFANI